MDRERRLQTTMAVGAVALLLVGVGIGYSIGRATAPKASAPAPTPVTKAEPTLTLTPSDTSTANATDTTGATDTVDSSITNETTPSVETTSDTQRPPRPRQLAPANGAVLSASRVTLSWSKVADESGKTVTYAFEIQDRRAGGTYGNAQTIKGLKTRSYSARVLTARRRWRVWAVDAAGNKSSVSPWRTFIHSLVVPKKSSATSSTATTTTEH